MYTWPYAAALAGATGQFRTSQTTRRGRIVTGTNPYRVPARMRARFDEVVVLTDALSRQHLDEEYAELCRRMAAALARMRPSPLERGERRTWAAGIVHALGWVNFLTDPAQQPHMTAAHLAEAAGVSQSSMAAASRRIRDALGLTPFDPRWTRPSRLEDNPLAWMIVVNGIALDVRDAPREIQEEAFRRGLIPYVPATRPADGTPQVPAGDQDATPSAARSPLEVVIAEAEETIGFLLATNPDATVDDVNAVLAVAGEQYNRRAQAELGGLSPEAVRELLDADWESPGSALRLDASVSLRELEDSFVLHDARLVLAMVGEGEAVKATPKGNFPRTFVASFLDRMRLPADQPELSLGEPRALNEDDVGRLHITRILLELSGLVKRRKGVIGRTRRGEQLAGEDRAGELLTTLLRTHFRKFNLGYLDGFDPAPEFQRTISYSFAQFDRAGSGWRRSAEWAERLVLPAVRDTVPANPHFDVLSGIVEHRFLRPLESFGLAESRESARLPGDIFPRRMFRKTRVFSRILSVRVAP